MVPYKPFFADGWSPGIVILPDGKYGYEGSRMGEDVADADIPHNDLRRVDSGRSSSNYYRKVFP
jgi:hypothetical protein